MRRELTLHPDSRCAAVTHIEVDAARPSAGKLLLRYVVTGTIADLQLPPVVAAKRADGLWRHTCFEAFVRVPSASEYFEFNLAPSTQWAAYGFDDHRAGMRALREIDAPRIETRGDGDTFTLQTSLSLDRLPDLPGDAAWRLGLAAVIEDAGGRMSYWALAHPPGKADFHHPDCFALELPPA